MISIQQTESKTDIFCLHPQTLLAEQIAVDDQKTLPDLLKSLGLRKDASLHDLIKKIISLIPIAQEPEPVEPEQPVVEDVPEAAIEQASEQVLEQTEQPIEAATEQVPEQTEVEQVPE